MRLKYHIVILAIAAFGVMSANADMYKYRDAQGNICFTDNLSLVPENQRPGISATATIDTAQEEETSTADEMMVDQNASSPEQEDAPKDLVVDEETIASLNLRQQELDAEFSGLMAEKYTLLQEKEKLSGLAGRDVEARKAYEAQVTELNSRISAYKARRESHRKECEQAKKALNQSSPEGGATEGIAE